jgi:ABC-type Mn2+/Zn2+ transport system permease subunit
MMLFDYPGAWQILLVAVVLGSFLSLLGIPLLLEKRSFTGVALSQTSALGAVVASVVGVYADILAFIFTLGALLLLEWVDRERKDDSRVALLFIISAALSTLIVSWMPTGEADLLTIQFGNILSILPEEAILSLIVGVLGIGGYLLVYKPFLVVINDYTTAKSIGHRPRLIQGVYSVLLALGITLGLKIFGVVLVFAFLIVPAFIMFRFSSKLKIWAVAGIIFTAVVTVAGLFLAFAFDFPPGVFIAAVLGLLGIVCWIAFRKRI